MLDTPSGERPGYWFIHYDGESPKSVKACEAYGATPKSAAHKKTHGFVYEMVIRGVTLMSLKLIYFKPIFQVYFKLKKFILMQNYGDFTQIYVL